MTFTFSDDPQLDRLMKLVAGGCDFPDAIFKVSQEFKLTNAEVSALEAKYDQLD